MRNVAEVGLHDLAYLGAAGRETDLAAGVAATVVQVVHEVVAWLGRAVFEHADELVGDAALLRGQRHGGLAGRGGGPRRRRVPCLTVAPAGEHGQQCPEDAEQPCTVHRRALPGGMRTTAAGSPSAYDRPSPYRTGGSAAIDVRGAGHHVRWLARHQRCGLGVDDRRRGRPEARLWAVSLSPPRRRRVPRRAARCPGRWSARRCPAHQRRHHRLRRRFRCSPCEYRGRRQKKAEEGESMALGWVCIQGQRFQVIGE